MTDTMRCPHRLWVRGEDRACGQTVGLTRWTDHTGVEHAACSRHVGSMKRRYPTSVPERTGKAGSLGLGSPWTRGKFAPDDVIEVENRIPDGYRIVVSSFSGSPYRFNLRAYNPEGAMVFDRIDRRDPVRDALEMAERLATLVAPLTETWTVAPDMSVTVGLDMTRPDTAA